MAQPATRTPPGGPPARSRVPNGSQRNWSQLSSATSSTSTYGWAPPYESGTEYRNPSPTTRKNRPDTEPRRNVFETGMAGRLLNSSNVTSLYPRGTPGKWAQSDTQIGAPPAIRKTALSGRRMND